MEKAVFQTQTTMSFGFWMSYAATLPYKSDWSALCCAPIIPLGTGTHYVVGEAQHQCLAGAKALFLTAPVPVTSFISASQLLSCPGSLTH